MKNNLKTVIEKAVARKKSLRGANLYGADLRGANLYGVNGIAAAYVPGMSSRSDYVYAVKHESTIMILAGCWWGTLEDTRQRVTSEKGDSLSAKLYIAALDMFELAFADSSND